MAAIGLDDLLIGLGFVLLAFGLWGLFGPHVAAIALGALFVTLGLLAARALATPKGGR